jgi:hypothetical protein
LCENNLAVECLMSQDPSSFTWLFSTFNCCLCCSNWMGPVWQTGFLLAAWEQLASVFITKGGNLGSFDPGFKESQLFVNYES